MRITILLLLLAAVTACNKSKPMTKQARMGLLADRTCRAISIRQQRFALANKIRFAQDTLSTAKDKKDSSRLQIVLKSYLEQKDTLLKQSLNLADTIRMQLDSLLPYTDKAAQQRFTSQLDSLLVQRGCKLPGQGH